MIDKFQRAYEKLEKFVEKQDRRIRELEEEFNEYKKWHPSTVGVKNSKTYAIKEDKAGEPQQGHRGLKCFTHLWTNCEIKSENLCSKPNICQRRKCIKLRRN